MFTSKIIENIFLFSICRETGLAETQPIPGTPVDGQWNIWSNWGDCSRTCNGTRSRFRLCSTPECGGKLCKKLNHTEVDTVQNENNATILREIEHDKCNQLCKFK